MRVAIVSTQYTGLGGTERVDDVLGSMYPEADLFTLFSDPAYIPPIFRGRAVRTSFLQNLPAIKTIYRGCLPLYPAAVASLDLRGYDLVISSDHSLMKSARVDYGALHICYCHTPWRQVWDLYEDSLKMTPALLRPVYAASACLLRRCDFDAAQKVDLLVANSKHISERIRLYYGRSSKVVYPPVNTQLGYLAPQMSDYYLSVGRLSPTKRTELAVQACTRLGRRLIVAGVGREYAKLKELAGPSVEFVGAVSDQQLADLYAHCRALLFSADEDFGIVPVEAQSFGRPVIAYGHGGALETVQVGDPAGVADTGVFFMEQTTASLVDGIMRFEGNEDSFIPRLIQSHSRQFDRTVFTERFREVIEQTVRSADGERSDEIRRVSACIPPA